MIKFCIISVGFTSLIILSVLLTILFYPTYLTIEPTKYPIQEVDNFEGNIFKSFGFNTNYNEGIDIVYIWIDQKSRIYLKDWKTMEDWKDLDQKFISDKPPNFIQYYLRFLWKNIPWIRRIHIVVPTIDYLRFVNVSNPKINVIEHKDFIKEKFLPNFNWRAVLSNVIDVDTISPHFLLFTDTMFPVNMDPSFFIDPSTGGRKIYLMNELNDPLVEEEENIIKISKDLILNHTQLPKNVYNVAKNITVETRVPILLSKSILKELENKFQDIFENIKSHRFRSTKSYDLLQLHQYYLVIENIKLNSTIEIKLNSFDTNKDGQIDENELKNSISIPDSEFQHIKLPIQIKNPDLSIINILKKQLSIKEYPIKLTNEANSLILESLPRGLSQKIKDFENQNDSILYLGSSFLMDATFQSLSIIENFFKSKVPEHCPYENKIPSPVGFINLAGIMIIGGGIILLMMISKLLSVKTIKNQ